MKSTVLSVVLLLSAAVVSHAQLSFLPQVGMEQSRTSLDYNSLSTSSLSGNFKAALRTDYRFKGGHGPFINLATSPSPVSFAFNNLGSLNESYRAAKNNLQFRIETGYQYTSHPIQLFRKKTSIVAGESTEATTKSSEGLQEAFTQKTGCGSDRYKSSCGEKKKARKISFANNDLNMRLQPSLGFAYIPSNTQSISQTTDGFQYASSWKTAIVPAMGFEFAKGKQRFLTLTVFYTKPLALKDETYTAFSGAKAVTTTVNPTISTWGITAGVPFSFPKSDGHKANKTKKNCHRVIYKRCHKI